MKCDIQGLLDRGELVVEMKEDNVVVIIPEFNILERLEVIFDSQKLDVTPLVVCPPGSVPYTFEKAIPYKYNTTMLENGRELPIPMFYAVSNIAEGSRVLRNGRVIPALFSKKASAPVSEQVQAENPVASPEKNKDAGQPSRASSNSDEVSKLTR